jgi:hypothetical protein
MRHLPQDRGFERAGTLHVQSGVARSRYPMASIFGDRTVKTFSIASSAFLVVAVMTMTAQAATVVTGGRCTDKQMNNKLTTCETSTFTNSAGQTGYKCTCTDKLVTTGPGRDVSSTPIDPAVTPLETAPAPDAPAQKAMPRN